MLPQVCADWHAWLQRDVRSAHAGPHHSVSRCVLRLDARSLRRFQVACASVAAACPLCRQVHCATDLALDCCSASCVVQGSRLHRLSTGTARSASWIDDVCCKKLWSQSCFPAALWPRLVWTFENVWQLRSKVTPWMPTCRRTNSGLFSSDVVL
jgi:hypothetical protein